MLSWLLACRLFAIRARMQRVSRVLSPRHALCSGHSLHWARSRNRSRGLCISWFLGVVTSVAIIIQPHE